MENVGNFKVCEEEEEQVMICEAVEANPFEQNEQIYHCFAQVGGSQSSKTQVQPEGQCSKEVEVEEEAWHHGIASIAQHCTAASALVPWASVVLGSS